jgi:D-glycero-D-manno-heptose 1,7-bisphosphate phosphatase
VTPAPLRSVRHVILDRDGVLNREAEDGGFVREPAEFHWLAGALEALALMRGAGVRLSVATNQSAVGRGLVSEAQLGAIHARMQAEAAAHGGALDAVLVCPHAPQEQCACRKPAPGLIQAALERAGIPAADSLVVGDDGRDIEAARRAGVGAVLVRSGKGRRAEKHLVNTAVYDDLLEVARAIVAQGR